MIPRMIQRAFFRRVSQATLLAVSRRRFPMTIGEVYRESSTFVSKHHVLQPTDVVAFLDQRGLQFRVSGREVIVKECPFCHDIGGKADNMWKLYIGLEKG